MGPSYLDVQSVSGALTLHMGPSVSLRGPKSVCRALSVVRILVCVYGPQGLGWTVDLWNRLQNVGLSGLIQSAGPSVRMDGSQLVYKILSTVLDGRSMCGAPTGMYRRGSIKPYI